MRQRGWGAETNQLGEDRHQFDGTAATEPRLIFVRGVRRALVFRGRGVGQMRTDERGGGRVRTEEGGEERRSAEEGGWKRRVGEAGG